MSNLSPVGAERLLKLAEQLETSNPEYIAERGSAKNAHWYGISESEAIELFCNTKNEMKWEQAKRIRQFVASKGGGKSTTAS